MNLRLLRTCFLLTCFFPSCPDKKRDIHNEDCPTPEHSEVV